MTFFNKSKKLRELPIGSPLRITLVGGIVANATFDRIDGSYSICSLDDSHYVVHIHNAAKMILVNDRWEIQD